MYLDHPKPCSEVPPDLVIHGAHLANHSKGAGKEAAPLLVTPLAAAGVITPDPGAGGKGAWPCPQVILVFTSFGGSSQVFPGMLECCTLALLLFIYEFVCAEVFGNERPVHDVCWDPCLPAKL